MSSFTTYAFSGLRSASCYRPLLLPPISNVIPSISKSDAGDAVTWWSTLVHAKKMLSLILPKLGVVSDNVYAILGF